MKLNKLYTSKTQLKDFVIQKELTQNIENLKKQFKNSNDLIIKDFKIGELKACLVYLIGLNDSLLINNNIMHPFENLKKDYKITSIKNLLENKILLAESSTTKSMEECVFEILRGKAILFIDSLEECGIFGVDKQKERAIQEPPTSAVLKGPRSGFTENIKTNIACIRKIIASTDLIFEHFKVGKYTQTQVSIFYISSIANKKVVNEIRKRIKKINIDGILDSFYVSQFLEFYPNSIFKQIGSCEKADIACSKILEGRVGILVDGSPIALTLPFLLLEDIQTSNDYYSQHSRATALRLIRIFSLIITLLLPGMYIAIELHHYKIIPLKFIVTIMNTTQQLPLSPFVEIIFVLLLFEVLYEASLRMPKYLGLALSIVGALILGDTATKAGLVSPPAVMIVALSGITLYTLPDLAPQLSMIRFAYTIAGGSMGFYGILSLTLFLLFHLNDFDSYNTAYLAPFSPQHKSDLKDTFFKKDITNMFSRPTSLKNKNKTRLKTKANDFDNNH